jgi:hypothetical protein
MDRTKPEKKPVAEKPAEKPVEKRKTEKSDRISSPKSTIKSSESPRKESKKEKSPKKPASKSVTIDSNDRPKTKESRRKKTQDDECQTEIPHAQTTDEGLSTEVLPRIPKPNFDCLPMPEAQGLPPEQPLPPIAPRNPDWT